MPCRWLHRQRRLLNRHSRRLCQRVKCVLLAFGAMTDMRNRIIWIGATLLLVLISASMVIARVGHGSREPAQTPEQMRASYEAHKGDFDYLLGDWEFTAHDVRGTYGGFWSAVQLETGQVLDQFRVTGPHGETWAQTTSLRGYSAAHQRWDLVSTRESNGLLDVGTAEKVGDEMHVEQTFGVSTAKPQRWRIRYHEISADRFLWNGDCSDDDGKTWQKDCTTIEAHRIGPARKLAPIAPSTRPAGIATGPGW